MPLCRFTIIILPLKDFPIIEYHLLHMEDCEKVLYNAELSEQTERFQDMAKYMRLFVVDRERLNLYQRSLLSIACKNVIGELRASWRVVSSIMSSEKDEAKLSIIKKYKLKLEREMDENCEEVQDTLERLILGSKDDPDAMVFYHKMKGDYLRYKSEYTHPNKTDTNSANLAYESSKRLPATSTIRLGLALSYSTMVYEILHDDKSAIKIAKDAFDAAIVELDSLNDNDFRDATLIMQLLRDNLTLWTPAEDDIKPS